MLCHCSMQLSLYFGAYLPCSLQNFSPEQQVTWKVTYEPRLARQGGPSSPPPVTSNTHRIVKSCSGARTWHGTAHLSSPQAQSYEYSTPQEVIWQLDPRPLGTQADTIYKDCFSLFQSCRSHTSDLTNYKTCLQLPRFHLQPCQPLQ